MFKGGRGGSPGAASHAWALANASQAKATEPVSFARRVTTRHRF